MEGIALQTLNAPMGIYIILLIGSCLLLTLQTLFQIQMTTYMQMLTPKDLIGKVISCYICIVMGTIPLGQFVFGFVFEHIGSSTYLPFYVVALIMIAISAFTRRIFYEIDHHVEQ